MNIGLSLTLNAARHPEKMAITCENRIYSYKELNREVNRMSNGLTKIGLKKGDRVGIFMKNSDYYVVAFYSLMKLGLIAVPINFRLTASETSYIIEQSGCSAVMCDSEFEEAVAEASNGNAKVIVQQAAKLPGSMSWNDVLSEDDTNPNVFIAATDDAEILYTSGTTGRPKGALFDHQRVLNVNTGMIMLLGLTSQDRFLHLAPLFHSAQLNLFLISGIMLGSSSVIHRDFHPVTTLESIQNYKTTVFFAVPAMYNALLQVPTAKEYDVSSIRACTYGAAPMAPSLVENSIDLFGTDQFFNLCGLTEGGPGGVYLSPEAHKTKLGAGGKAMFYTIARVVNEEMEDVKPGETGEFVLKGETIMKEYYRNSEETEKTFSDGWLLTGDLATIDEDGFITIVDRKKDMIITGGENVYSVEVEQVLNSHPQVLEAATIGVPDEKWGELVAAVIVPKAEEIIDEEEIQRFCREKLAGYKIPRKFFYSEVLPRNASGKILKYALREINTSKVT
ncbi:class I adenylate-forming enzyme family protein [Sporosarcina sp. CAU 1771]